MIKRGIYNLFHRKKKISNWDLVVKKWQEDNGNKTLLVEYILNNNSVVVEVGGYLGDWSSEIFARYSSNIYVFEPLKDNFKKLKGRFKFNKKIRLYNFGLWKCNGKLSIKADNDSSSLVRPGSQREVVNVRDVIELKNIIDTKYIDLMQINIEGGEFALLERLIETGYINNIKNLQIQFHKDIPESSRKMEILHQKLRRTHIQVFYYSFVWEGWKIK